MLIYTELEFLKSNITLFGTALRTIAKHLGLTGNWNFCRNSVYDNKQPNSKSSLDFYGSPYTMERAIK